MAQRRYRSSSVRRMLGRMGLLGGRGVVIALVALATCAVGAGVLWELRPQEVVIERSAPVEDSAAEESEQASTTAQDISTEAAETRYVVHVDGAVLAPGVVEVVGTDVRVFDAVTAAGGLAEDAETTSINLAEPLADGAKIHIPHVGETETESAFVPSPGQAETAGATGVDGATSLVNINTATVEELQTLSGVGEVTARAIVDEREQNGPFASIEDLMRVSGIGEKKFAKVRDAICV